MKSDAPCLNCDNRYLGCHDKCVSYKEYKSNREELKKLRQDSLIYNHYMSDKIKAWRAVEGRKWNSKSCK